MKLSLLKITLFFGIIAQSDIVSAQLTIDDDRYQIDKNLHLILCNAIPTGIVAGNTSITLGETYKFLNPVTRIQVGKAYAVTRNDTTYQLYFTHLPIITLNVATSIGGNEISGLVTVRDTLGTPFRSAMGIKIRGSYSRTFPKKSYHIDLWTDSTGKTTQDESLLGMRNDHTWLLLAMYNEKLRLNNKVSHDLWLKIHKLYYADLEPDAHATIHTRYVEAFLNGAYQGVYLFAEDMDRKELKLKKQTAIGTGGELYKGTSWDVGTLFTGVPSLPAEATALWGGWELHYPDSSQTNWASLQSFTDFAVNTPDSTFKRQISTKIREDNFADYFIFLNLLRAEDNQGKNLFLARYNETAPYFIAPWDLDGTWGYYWSGDQKNVTNDILSNNLFNRLLSANGSFKSQIARRWFSLRDNTFSVDSLYASIENNHTFLSTNGVYERESMVWAGDYLSYGQQELDYVRSWIQNRVDWLDNYFKTFAGDQPLLYSFDASTKDSDVILKWSANYPAIQSFDVQVSFDNSIWRTITSNSLSANDSTSCTCSFTDTHGGATSLYYRLIITDKNRAVSYSPVRSVHLDLPAAASVAMFPNPVSSTLQVWGNVEKVRIFSSQGVSVYEATDGDAAQINVQTFPAGVYLVQVTQKDGLISSHRIVVNR